MKAAWYERQGPAAEVLVVGEMPERTPGLGEVRIRVRASGVNPGDIKKREGWLGSQMPYARVIPHSDGAGEIDQVGAGVTAARLGERAWCYGAQSYRQFGTAAEFVVVPSLQAVALDRTMSFEQGACLGIPGLTAHRAVFSDGSVVGRHVLVNGAAGAVGSMAVALARWGGAIVLATVRRPADRERALAAGANQVFLLGKGQADDDVDGDADVAAQIRGAAPGGVDRIVEVALGANGALDAAVITQGGVIAAYASAEPEPRLPFWPLLFQNATIRLLGSDDFPQGAKQKAATELGQCFEDGKLFLEIGPRFPLDQIAAAHQAVELPAAPGRVIVTI
jgi:NADPH2:quinone reductase